MSSFGYYALDPTCGSNSQMLVCTCTPHIHYYPDDMLHNKEWLHLRYYPDEIFPIKKWLPMPGSL
jgi:hypothetical protein